MFVLFTSLKSGEDFSVWLVSAEAEAQKGWVFMPPDEFERLIEDAAERGAKRHDRCRSGWRKRSRRHP